MAAATLMNRVRFEVSKLKGARFTVKDMPDVEGVSSCLYRMRMAGEILEVGTEHTPRSGTDMRVYVEGVLKAFEEYQEPSDPEDAWRSVYPELFMVPLFRKPTGIHQYRNFVD